MNVEKPRMQSAPCVGKKPNNTTTKGVSRNNPENALTPLSIEGFVHRPMRDDLADPTIGADVDATDNPFSLVVSRLESALDK